MGGCAVLILAGGTGARMGSETPKQYLDLSGAPVLRRTVAAFRTHPAIDGVRVVIGPEDRSAYDSAVSGLDLPAPVIGGANRQQSALNGLEALAADAPDIVLIHDAARPFVDRDTIGRVLTALETHEAALPALPVSDTLKRGAGSPAIVGETIARDGLWRAQTPQGFRFEAILEAHRKAAGADYTDDTAVAEAAGIAVALVEGNEDNFKITTPADLVRARRIADAMSGETRIGNGFDVHAFGGGDRVVLCGVEIPNDRGLDGHSDADVAMHAVTDALLGAVGDGDIGSHFPPSDPQWKGAPSRVFLEHAAKLIADRGGSISNVDLTIVCEEPKIGPHREAMRRSLADILRIDIGRVSVKATTTEKLGFTGRGEGIAAQAAAAVRLP